MIQWPEEVIQTIGRRKSVVVIGSGVSKNSTTAKGQRPDNWEDFLKSVCKAIADPKVVEDLIQKRDFLTACELLRSKLTSHVFMDVIQNAFQKPGFAPAKIHEHIYGLDASIVLSPNFDNIYDTYALTTSKGTVVIKDHTSTDTAFYLAGGEHRLILKTHGSANNPDSIIFTRSDYAAARTKHSLFYELIKSLVLTHTFLFLGCGVDDPDIRLIFEDVQYAHSRLPYHYMTLPQGEVDPEVQGLISNSMKVKFLLYSPDNGHAELTSSLEDLVAKVDSYRQLRSADQKW